MNNVKCRIKQYRVDVAYTRGAYYNAYYRLSRQNKWRTILRRWMVFASFIFGLTVLSGLLNQLYGQQNVTFTWISTLFSVLSLLITFYLRTLDKIVDPEEYLRRADGFTFFYKSILTDEASINDDLIDSSEQIAILHRIEERYKVIYTNPLPILKVDYERSRKDIKKGKLTYTEEDFKNTYSPCTN